MAVHEIGQEDVVEMEAECPAGEGEEEAVEGEEFHEKWEEESAGVEAALHVVREGEEAVGTGDEAPEGVVFAESDMAQFVTMVAHKLAPEETWSHTFGNHKYFEQILRERSSYP